MILEERICPSCKKPFKVLPISKQVFCAQRCIEFKTGKQLKLKKSEMLDFKRRGFRFDQN